jgi:ABC-type branched-subunit amino acid transport system ATPase component
VIHSTTQGRVLTIEGLSRAFYGVKALDNVSLTVASGEILGLIGPNGSGKTTLIDCVTGFLRADRGSIRLDGRDITAFSPNRLAAERLVRTFQSVRVFPTLTVRQNIEVGGFATAGVGGFFGRAEQWKQHRRRADDLIDQFNLRRVAADLASSLSYGQRKLVEFAAGLMCEPRIVFFDEPVAAVNPTLALTIRQHIRDLHERGTTIVLVEHNMELVMGICDRLVVLDHGVKIADGLPQEVIARPLVQEAYFGR